MKVCKSASKFFNELEGIFKDQLGRAPILIAIENGSSKDGGKKSVSKDSKKSKGSEESIKDNKDKKRDKKEK